jgi:hypothetical protein
LAAVFFSAWSRDAYANDDETGIAITDKSLSDAANRQEFLQMQELGDLQAPGAALLLRRRSRLRIPRACAKGFGDDYEVDPWIRRDYECARNHK